MENEDFYSDELLNKILYIADYFGLTGQLSKFTEEAGEAIAETSRSLWDRTDEQRSATVSELADVYIMIIQLIVLLDKKGKCIDEFQSVVESKVDRTLERIADRYYIEKAKNRTPRKKLHS